MSSAQKQQNCRPGAEGTEAFGGFCVLGWLFFLAVVLNEKATDAKPGGIISPKGFPDSVKTQKHQIPGWMLAPFLALGWGWRWLCRVTEGLRALCRRAGWLLREQQVAMIQFAVAMSVLNGARTTSTKGAFLGWEGADLSAVFM